MSSPTPRSFAARYLRGQRLDLTDGGLLATCPACSTINSFRIDADASGAYVACSAGSDTASPCDATAFAAALDLHVDDFTALLESIRPEQAAASASPAPRTSLRDRIGRRSDLATLEALEPLIADTVLRKTLTFMAGPPASGKSFHLLAWAASVATGTPWRGRSVKQGRVLYVIAEGAYGIDDRLAAWESFHAIEILDTHFDYIPEAVQLADPDAFEELVAVVRDEDYDLVIIDTLSRSAVGLDENSQAAMSTLVAASDRIKDAMTNGALVVAHHSSKGGSGLRGSSVLEGAADSVYVTSKGHAEDGSTGAYWLARAKNKYGPESDFLTFAWHTEGDSGLLVEPLRRVVEAPRDALASAATWRTLLDALDHGQTFTRHEAQRLVVTDGGTVTKSSFYRHWTDLLGRGALVLHASDSGRSADYFRLDLSEAGRTGLPVDRFNPLDGFSNTFLDAALTGPIPIRLT